MDKVKEIYLNKLTLEDIEAHLPDGFQQQLLHDASQGHQPPSTFILGRVNELSDKVMWKGCFKKLIVLKEVITDDSEGKFIRVTLYKDYAESVDNILKKWGTSKRLWIALSDTEIGKYMGLGTVEKWCSLCIHAGYGGLLPQIWLFREGAAPVAGSYPLQTNGALNAVSAPLEKMLTPLMQCLIGNRYNVMAVVSEIVKHPSITRIGKLHMMIGLVDPSCPVASSPDAGDTVKDILLNVFTANTSEVRSILDRINAGDVVRLRGLKMEKYNDSLRASIYNENQLILFSGNQDSDLVPYTVCSSYSLTDRDEDKVKSLREWTRDNFRTLPSLEVQPSSTRQQGGPTNNAPGNAAVTERMIDPIFLYIRISEITGDRLFHLSCKVNMKQYLERDFNRLAILRVCDGTRTSKYFRTWDIDETSDEYEDEVFAPHDSEEVDIIVFTNVDMLENVNVGDFILLKNITCIPLETNVNDKTVTFYELSMKNEDSHIKKLKKNDQAVKDIKRTLEKNTEERELVDSSEESLLNIFQKANSKSTIQRNGSSPLKKSPNRIPCQPLSPPRSRTRITSGSPRSPRTLQRGERSPESFREHTGLSSPKLPSMTDSIDNAMRNINSIFDGEKSGLSSQQSGAVPITSTQERSPAREQSTSPKGKSALKPGFKGAISPILAPASGSNGLVQPDTDVHPQPGCSKWFIDNNVFARENLPVNGATKASLPSHVQKPQDFVASVRNSSFESLLPLSPVQKILSEESSNIELPVPLSSLSSHQSPYGEKSVERRTMSTKRKLVLSEGDKSAEDSYKKKHPRLIPDSDLPDSSTSISDTQTKGEKLQKSNKITKGTTGELLEPDTNVSAPISVENISDMRIIEPNRSIAEEEFENESSIKFGRKPTGKEPSTASSNKFESEKSLDPGNVQVMRKVKERDRPDKARLDDKTRSDRKEQGERGPVKKIPRLTTDFSQKAFYSTICDIRNTDERGVTHRVPAHVVQVGISSSQPCTAVDCLQGICFHDWIWGLCTVCGIHFESWEMREQYSVEDFKSKSLPCSSCSRRRQSTVCQTPKKKSKTLSSPCPRKSPRTKTVSSSSEVSEKVSDMPRQDKSSIGDAYTSNSVVPYISSMLILEDPDDNSNILVHVAGDDAKAFYGAEPTFEWLTNRADNPIRRLVSVLLKQKAPLWYGVQKCISENSGDYYLVRHTQLISGKLNDTI